MSPVLAIVLLFVGIVILVLIHICVIEWRFRAAAARGIPAAEVVAAAAMSIDDVEMLPSFDFNGSVKDAAVWKSPPNCAVCLDYFNDGDKCRLLPLCKHSFHAECVDGWLVKMPSCPICRSRASSERFSDVTGATNGSRDSSLRFLTMSGRSEGLSEREMAGHNEEDGDESIIIQIEERGNNSGTTSDHGNLLETTALASLVNEGTIPPAS